MTTHLLIKAIALHVRALAMMDANHAEFSCGGKPQWDFDDFEDLQKQIEQLAVEAEVHDGPDTVSLTTQMSIAASEGARAGYDKLLRDAVANDHEQTKSVGITAPLPPLFEHLYPGYSFHGVAVTGKHYIASITNTHKTRSLMTRDEISVVMFSIHHFNGKDVEPFSRSTSYEDFKKEFRNELED